MTIATNKTPTPTVIAARAPTATTPSLRTVFAAAVRSEWTKLRTVRSTIWALAFTVISIVGLGALLTALEVSRWNHRSLTEIAGFDPLLYAFAAIPVAQLSLGVLGVLVMTSEYAKGGIKLTFAATPQRPLLLAAKATTFAAVAAVVSIVSCFTAFFICEAILGPSRGGASITDPHVLRAVLGGALHLVLIGVIAAALGAVLRHTAGAIAVLFGVLLILPGLALLLPTPWDDKVTKFLPSSAGVAISAIVSFPNLLSPINALIVLVADTAAMCAVATLVLVRHDA
jgi:ABC-2 type transport system permease protein